MNRILFITAFPPNRKTAGQNYSKELLYSLKDTFDIDLISFSYPNHDIEIDKRINILKYYRVSKISKLLGWLQLPFIYPFFTFRFRLDLLFYLIKNAKKYNVVYFDFSQVFIYSLFLRKSYKVMMSHDVIFQKMKRSKWFILNPFNLLLYNTEKAILKTANLILVFSKKDQNLFKELYGLKSNVVSFFISDKIKELHYDKINLERKFCFFGAWNRPENLQGLLWFMENIYLYTDENIKFEIIGPGLNESFLEKYNTTNRIRYLGFIDNPYIAIAESIALIAPIFQGAGVKVKVIESLATGTSVLGTEIAFEGIDNLGDNSMILCTTVQDFIENINLVPIDLYKTKLRTKELFEKTYRSNKFEEILEGIL
jgi:hypothetical protein